MGKSILIIITGMFIVMGSYQFANQSRLASIDSETALKAWNASAYTNAVSALEAAAQKILLDPAWANSGETYNQSFPEGPARVTVDRQGRIITLNSLATVENTNVQIEARYEWLFDFSLPNVESAMGIYSEKLDFNIAGSAFSISGHDYFSNGTINPDGQSVYGIAVNHEKNKDLILDELNNNQKDKITGSGGTPSIEHISYDVAQLEQLIAMLIKNADVYHTGKYTAQGAGSLGTRENPQIVVVDGILEVSNATGVGIIIIKDGGEMDVRGNLDHYEGLIFVQGAARLVRGNIKVFGAMFFGGEDPELEIDIDLRGNVHIAYSSEVVDFIEAQISSRAAGQLRLLSMYQ